MFDDLIQDIDCNPSPRIPRQRSKIKNLMAGARSHVTRRLARAKAAPALPSYSDGISPDYSDAISATRVYTATTLLTLLPSPARSEMGF
jgi:hypothetical protein